MRKIIILFVCLVQMSCAPVKTTEAPTTGLLPRGDFPQASDVRKKSDIKPDYVLALDTNDPDIVTQHDLNIKTFQETVLKITIKSKEKIVFETPSQLDFPCLRSAYLYSNLAILDGQEGYEETMYFMFFPRSAQDFVMAFKNNFLKEDFKLNVYVTQGETTFEELVEKAGFEREIKSGTPADELKEKFGAPAQETATFQDGWKVYYYNFHEYGLAYQVLSKDGKVFDYKRIQ